MAAIISFKNGILPMASSHCVLAFSCLFWFSSGHAQLDHSIWNDLLHEHIAVTQNGRATRVDYQGMAEERSILASYLNMLSSIERAEFESWNHADQLAFLINAYNAWTVELILQEGPDLDSIRDIGFLPNAAWRRNFISLFGDQISLDDIEHGMIRGWGRYKEPRIHFAVNCAAIGCPALRNEAYVGNRLIEQLEEGTKLFLSDRTRNYKERDRLVISRIFDWYEEDFEQGWQGINSVTEFLLIYTEELDLTEQDALNLQQRDLRIRYADYDWDLNRVRTP